MTTEELWQAAIGEIELSVSRANFVTWIKNANLIRSEDGTATLEVPNNFTKEWLQSKCSMIILRALRNISSDIKKVSYVVVERSVSQKPNRRVVSQQQLAKAAALETQMDLLELAADHTANLNPKYGFDAFVVGSFNELAHAAAISISKPENVGKAYNPFFVYGGVGLGKTHLIQSIGNALLKENPNLLVKYTPSETFTSELITAIQNQSVEEFKLKYRKVDVLIIDDIQFIAGKKRTQEEFFHTFNSLYAAGKQIILSSDRPPKAISTLEERLKSRFEGGMTTDIGFPDYESRIAILKTKLETLNLELPDTILDFIASKITKNVRELEGALTKLSMVSATSNTPITLDTVKALLKGLLSSPKHRTTPSKILKTVAEFYEVPVRDIIEGGRKKELVKPRQISMYLMREELRESYPSIGKKLGGRDHTTVIHACEKIDRELKADDTLEMEINLVKERIYGEGE